MNNSVENKLTTLDRSESPNAITTLKQQPSTTCDDLVSLDRHSSIVGGVKLAATRNSSSVKIKSMLPKTAYNIHKLSKGLYGATS